MKAKKGTEQTTVRHMYVYDDCTGGGVDELAVDEELGELDLRHLHAGRRRLAVAVVAAVARH